MPELVILSYARWRMLVPNDVSEDLLEALANDDTADIDRELPLPGTRPRHVDLD